MTLYPPDRNAAQKHQPSSPIKNEPGRLSPDQQKTITDAIDSLSDINITGETLSTFAFNQLTTNIIEGIETLWSDISQSIEHLNPNEIIEDLQHTLVDTITYLTSYQLITDIAENVSSTAIYIVSGQVIEDIQRNLYHATQYILSNEMTSDTLTGLAGQLITLENLSDGSLAYQITEQMSLSKKKYLSTLQLITSITKSLGTPEGLEFLQKILKTVNDATYTHLSIEHQFSTIDSLFETRHNPIVNALLKDDILTQLMTNQDNTYSIITQLHQTLHQSVIGVKKWTNEDHLKNEINTTLKMKFKHLVIKNNIKNDKTWQLLRTDLQALIVQEDFQNDEQLNEIVSELDTLLDANTSKERKDAATKACSEIILKHFDPQKRSVSDLNRTITLWLNGV